MLGLIAHGRSSLPIASGSPSNAPLGSLIPDDGENIIDAAEVAGSNTTQASAKDVLEKWP
jgi:hypothetical protein